MNQSTPPPFIPWPFNKALLIAMSLGVIEVLVWNQFLLPIGMLVYVMLWGLPRVYLAQPWRIHRSGQLINLGIYAAVAVLAMAANVGNNLLADHRANQVIAAVEAFKAKQGHYPKTLDELVPAQLSEVPQAKIGFMLTRFYYSAEPKPSLFYVVFPPFGRKTYNFETRSFGFRD
jgi:hypothetical protein